ncbi:type I methionyl aminopeptidase [Galbitalea soli]|uniref:Methionine aminopeptidase n=1 Tax=Galbitalea soli TaxID=1268042 RepID=A0A7C9TQU4_9MICO|nr:type I methionyl aminopeptidase [Galbitalea soli]NYJ29928.1 methionyl aminopeptidase [Galbitalea soli]
MARGLYKSPDELRALVRPGLVTARALEAVRRAIAAGVTTGELDAIAERVIRDAGGRSNFMLEPGYSHTICASVNDEVVHGVPGDRVIEPGDIVSIDCGAEVGGWNGDAAITVVVPDDRAPALVARRRELAEVTRLSLWAGIAAFARGATVNDIGAAVENSVEAAGPWGIIEDYTGHGIGRSMHEEPTVYNYRVRRAPTKLRAGLVLAIEPMVTAGGIDTRTLDDGWTVVTEDGSDAAHWEHSIARHDAGIWVLTAEDGGAAELAAFGIRPVPIP